MRVKQPASAGSTSFIVEASAEDAKHVMMKSPSVKIRHGDMVVDVYTMHPVHNMPGLYNVELGQALTHELKQGVDVDII